MTPMVFTFYPGLAKGAGMKKKEKYRLWVTRREAFDIDDEPDHTMMIVEMEGEPLEYQVGVAGEFVSRRSITIHDRVKGWGLMEGYVMAFFQHGAAYSRFKGNRDGLKKITEGTWKTYRGTGKLAGTKGQGDFTLVPTENRGEFVLHIEGDYEAA
jgi:hypothetical protein